MSARNDTMHVLMTTDSVGGVWTYALELAEATAELGVRYTLACLGPRPSSFQRQQAESLANVRLQCFPGKLEWMDDPWNDVDASGAWLRSLAQRDRPDIVHLNGYAHGAESFDAPVIVAAHSCVLSWWHAVRGSEAPPEWSKYRQRVRAGLAAADLVVAPTAAMLHETRRFHGPLSNTQVIYNGRRAPKLLETAKRPIIASVGRIWDDAKNIATLGLIADELPWPCVVAGDATRPSGGIARFANVGLLGKASQDDVWKLLSRAAILVHPARYEPFGLVPLEAALVGCALVLGDIDSLREVWADAACYVNPGDPEHLRRELCKLIENQPLRHAMSLRARARAARYATESFGRAYASAYSSLISRQVGPPFCLTK